MNFTNPQSRIMLTSNNGWQQAWNAQAAVDMDSHLIVGGHISQAPNDKQQLEPILNQLQTLPEELGNPTRLTADNGYYSEALDRNITPYLATGRQKHNQRWDERGADPGPPPEGPGNGLAAGNPGRKSFLRAVEGDRGAGLWDYKTRDGIPAVSASGVAEGDRRVNLVQCAYNLKRMHALAT